MKKTVKQIKPKSAPKKVVTQGHVIQIIGPVVDVDFTSGNLPNIYDALTIQLSNQPTTKLTLEVQQHLGDNIVRTVALSSTDGLKRGTTAHNTGAPISVPVGKETLGRILNVTGQTIDGKGQIKAKKYYHIHRDSPTLAQQETKLEILETGIKVIDLIAPFIKGGKIGVFGGAGVGKTVIIQELINNIAK